MEGEMIEQVRRFNRTVTQRIGALDDAFLARDRPLGQARLLWEIGPDGSDVRALRARLDLDSGYLSRLLRCLAGAGLGSLTGRQRDRLITAMAEVERLLTASAIELAGTDPRAPGALACQRAYASELADRFEAGYDP